MIDMELIEKTLIRWTVIGSGLPSSRVILSRQAGHRREGPWLDLGFTSLGQVGTDSTVVEPNPSPAPGQEIRIRHLGYRAGTVSFRCFAGPTGSSSPLSILNRLVGRARFIDQLALFKSAGIGMLQCLPIADFSGPLGTTVFEPRAQMDMLVNLASEDVEYTTFIERVELVNGIDDTTQIVGPP